MRILYIGDTDKFAKMLVSRLEQEEEEVFVVAPEEFPQNYNVQRKYKFFKEQENPKLNRILFDSINPDVIIFAGKGYSIDVWKDDDLVSKYISDLHLWCDLCVKSKCVDFIYLSSTQALDEQPKTVKGIQYSLGKEIVSFYNKRAIKQVQTLYCESMFSFEQCLGDGSFLADIVKQVKGNESLTIENDELVSPVYVGDVVDAILRVMLRPKSDEYVICGSDTVEKSKIYKYFSDTETFDLNIVTENPCLDELEYSNEKAKKELEWRDVHSLNKLIDEKKISINDFEEPKKLSKKLFSQRSTLRKTLENIFLFLVFVCLDYFTASNSVLNMIEIMTLYIVVASAIYGVSGGLLGVILRAVGFFITSWITQVGDFGFHMYIDTMMMIAQSVFITLVVAYPIDYLRSLVREKNNKIIDTEKQNDEIKEINQSNVIIKNEYQQRLLDSKNSFSVLHKTITRINSLKSERIFMEVVEVVAELIETSTVSVYRCQNESGFFRLITNLNEESMFGGYSLDLNAYPQMKDCITKGNIYVGNTWENEPAFVAPILHNMNLSAIIVIKDLSFEKQTLYQLNLLRTITALASDAINKAMQYEKLSDDEEFVDGTKILKCECMKQKISLEKEKSEKHLSHYVLLEVENIDDVECISTYQCLEKLIRKDDILGLGENKEVLLLLPSTPIKNISFVINRFEKNGMKVNIIGADLAYENVMLA